MPGWMSPKSRRAKGNCLRSRGEEQRVYMGVVAEPVRGLEGRWDSRNGTDRGAEDDGKEQKCVRCPSGLSILTA